MFLYSFVPSQYGFQHNRSTIYPILDFDESCLDNIDKSNIPPYYFWT